MDQTTKTHVNIKPSIALFSLMVYSVVVALSNHISFSMLIPLCVSGWIYRMHVGAIFRKLIFLNTLIALVVLTLLLQAEYHNALLLFVRSNCIVLFGLILFCDKDEFSIALAMHQLHFPMKLVTMVFFTAKSIFLIRHEFVRFKTTLKVRGFELKTNLLSYKTVAGFIGILIIKAISRASALQKAMLLRGFNGSVYRLDVNHQIDRYDGMVVIALLGLAWQQGVLV